MQALRQQLLLYEKGVNLMNDLIIQFAILWGIELADTQSAWGAEKAKMAEEMKHYDSEELLEIFSAWATEFMSQRSEDDPVFFFNEKLTDLMRE